MLTRVRWLSCTAAVLVVIAGSGQPHLNRSQVDLLKGFLSPLRRMVLERRVTRDTPEVVRALRERLESGAPPEAM